jgi:hypothetical protein
MQRRVQSPHHADEHQVAEGDHHRDPKYRGQRPRGGDARQRRQVEPKREVAQADRRQVGEAGVLGCDPFMRLGTRGSPSWPGSKPETDGVDGPPTGINVPR